MSCFVVVRKPNYDSVSIALCEQALEKAGLPTNIVVDCSHANSNKDHNVQPLVLDDVAHQIKDETAQFVAL